MIASSAIANFLGNMKRFARCWPAAGAKTSYGRQSAAPSMRWRFRSSNSCERAKVRGENHWNLGHSASLSRKPELSPSYKRTADGGMVTTRSQVDVLTAGRAGQTRREFRPMNAPHIAATRQCTQPPRNQNGVCTRTLCATSYRVGKNSPAPMICRPHESSSRPNNPS